LHHPVTIHPGGARAAGPSLLFRVHGRLCALPLAHVVETMRPLPVEPVAGALPCVAGVSVIRGAPLPVVDLVRLLGAAAQSGDPSSARPASGRFIAVRVADRAAALAVDSVVGVRFLDESSLRDLPALLRDADSDVVESIGTLDTELLVVLRAARLVPTGLPGEVMPGGAP
jgi:purine-binding chemotaxis protein CheW